MVRVTAIVLGRNYVADDEARLRRFAPLTFVRRARNATLFTAAILHGRGWTPAYNRFTCAAHFEGFGGAETRGYMMTMERIRAFLASLGHHAERVYTSNDPNPTTFLDGTPVPADVKTSILPPPDATQRLVDAVTEGQVIVAHRDHGSPDGWFMPPFQIQHLQQVNGTVPSVFYSLNCLTGTWNSTTTTQCFAEALLAAGVPSLIAATELSNTFLNNSMMLALFDAMYGGVLPTFPGTTASYPIRFNRLGDILNYSRSYLPLVNSNPNAVRSHYEMYHLLGDPSLEMWAHAPTPLRVKAHVTTRGLTVDLSTLAPHCVVTVWYEDRLLIRKTPASARFTIAVPRLPVAVRPSMERRRIVISAWTPGYHYAETQVAVPVFAPVFVPAH